MKIVYIKNVAMRGSNHMKVEFEILPSELQQALSKQHIYMDNNTLYISSQMSKCDLLFYITKFNLLDYTEVTDTGMLIYAKKYDKVHTIQGKHYVSIAIVYEYCSIHKPLLVGKLVDRDKYVGAIVLVREPNNYHLKPVMFSDELKGFINGFINGNEVYIRGTADCNIPIYNKNFQQLNSSAMIVGITNKLCFLLYNGKLSVKPIDSLYQNEVNYPIVDGSIYQLDDNFPIIANTFVINGNVLETGVGRVTTTVSSLIEKPNLGDNFEEVRYAINRARKGSYSYNCNYKGIAFSYSFESDRMKVFCLQTAIDTLDFRGLGTIILDISGNKNNCKIFGDNIIVRGIGYFDNLSIDGKVVDIRDLILGGSAYNINNLVLQGNEILIDYRHWKCTTFEKQADKYIATTVNIVKMV